MQVRLRKGENYGLLAIHLSEETVYRSLRKIALWCQMKQCGNSTILFLPRPHSTSKVQYHKLVISVSINRKIKENVEI